MLELILIGIIGLILVLAIIIGIWAITIYNRCVELKNRVKNSDSKISAAVKRILMKLKNLESAFEKTTGKESEIWKLFAEVRKVNPNNHEDVEKFNDVMPKLVGNIHVVMEQYPELKAIPEIGKLFYEDVNHMYEQYIDAINAYNNVVYEYNVYIQKFPNNIFAKMFGFKEEKMFETKNIGDIKSVTVDEEKLSNMVSEAQSDKQ
jgi:LemA protein